MFKNGEQTEFESLFEDEARRRFVDLQNQNLIGGSDVSNEYLSYISRLSVREEIIELSISETNPHPRHINNDTNYCTAGITNA